MQIRIVKLHPLIAKASHYLSLPWKKYSEYFDNNCWGIWGLSRLLKYTLLYFFVIFTPALFGWIKLEGESSSLTNYAFIFLIGMLVTVIVWFIYTPLLCLILLFRLFKKTKNSLQELQIKISQKPWEMTPIKLYTKPHSDIVRYSIYLKEYIDDFLDWSSQFYPISLLYVSPIKYPLNLKIRKNVKRFEINMAFLNIPLKCVDFEINQQFVLYKFQLYKQVKDISKITKKLNKHFKVNDDFYIKEENGQIQIMIPNAQ